MRAAGLSPDCSTLFGLPHLVRLRPGSASSSSQTLRSGSGSKSAYWDQLVVHNTYCLSCSHLRATPGPLDSSEKEKPASPPLSCHLTTMPATGQHQGHGAGAVVRRHASQRDHAVFAAVLGPTHAQVHSTLATRTLLARCNPHAPPRRIGCMSCSSRHSSATAVSRLHERLFRHRHGHQRR